MARPTKMTPECIKKLEYAYLCGANNTQAAIIADISEVTLYDYIKKNPEFLKKIESLKGMTRLRAKVNISTSIEGGDESNSKWYLERRDPDFKPKQESTVTGSKGFIDAILAKKAEGCKCD